MPDVDFGIWLADYKLGGDSKANVWLEKGPDEKDTKIDKKKADAAVPPDDAVPVEAEAADAADADDDEKGDVDMSVFWKFSVLREREISTTTRRPLLLRPPGAGG